MSTFCQHPRSHIPTEGGFLHDRVQERCGAQARQLAPGAFITAPRPQSLDHWRRASASDFADRTRFTNLLRFISGHPRREDHARASCQQHVSHGSLCGTVLMFLAVGACLHRSARRVTRI
ncbi:unnamed protein product [Prorocentrum cordatum]|uniref:Uncharacterized protein n=1 Tax=Prorocentrum cordatum TaxID=2364126 RepID=A0ABN9XH94_9DINO|nr:unnamed protein product [Polarella glacialis]